MADAPSEPILRLAGWIQQAPRILFITGAGISADSGLPTYRGVGGLYEGAGTEDGLEIEHALSGSMMATRPEVCWKYIGQVEQACRGAAPNRAHEVIAELQRRRDGVVVLTQNVDGLHRAAGSEHVIEIHGNVHELHCTRCAWERVVPDYKGLALPPQCPACGALVRPRVVLFEEALPAAAVERLRAEVGQGFALVVTVGTTAAFPYVAAPVHMAAGWGAHTAEINPGQSLVSQRVELRLAARAAPTFDALAVALGYG
jgi:NAD-dependent deacetylase